MASNCVKDVHLRAMDYFVTAGPFLPFTVLDARLRGWFHKTCLVRGKGKSVDHAIHWVDHVLPPVQLVGHRTSAKRAAGIHVP